MNSIGWILPAALAPLAMLWFRSKRLATAAADSPITSRFPPKLWFRTKRPADSASSSETSTLTPDLWFRSKRSAAAASTSLVSTLPPELLLRIAIFLPAPSAGAFALCTKPLYQLLSIPYIKCRRGHSAFDTPTFLRLLEPDLPDHVVCFYCEKLHEIRHAARHVQVDRRCDVLGNETMTTYIHPRFSYVVFQMAMKRHRQGRDCAALLDLLSYKESDSGGTSKTETSCRIVDGSLLVRQQHVFIVHSRMESRFTLYMKTMICPHKELQGKLDHNATGRARYCMSYTPGNIDIDRTPTIVRCDCCSYLGTKDEGNWSGLIRCRACATEFRIDTLAIGKDGKAFVVTRWKDLGEGRDTEDLVWRAHLGAAVVAGPRKKGGLTVCRRFEGEGWRGGLESLLETKEMKRLVNFNCR